MRMNSIFLIILLIPGLPVGLSALDMGGEVQAYTAAKLNGGEFLKNSALLRLRLQQRIGDGAVRAELDGFYSTVHSNQPALMIKELGYRARFNLDGGFISRLELQGGLCRYTWGKSDEIRILDILNPQYLNYVTFDPIEERKLGRLAFDLGIKLANGMRLQAILLPILQKSVLDYYPLMPKAMQDAYTLQRTSTNGFSVQQVDPAASGLKQASVGLRFRDSRFGIDYDVYLYHGYFNQPSFFWRSALLVEEEYTIVDMLGMDFETTLGSLGLRGELAWFNNGRMFFLQPAAIMPPLNDGTMEKRFLQIVLGVDGRDLLLRGFYFNLQYGFSHIIDYDANLLPRESEHLITWKLEYGFDRNTITVALNGAIYLERGSFINPELSFRITGGGSLNFGVYLITADKEDYMFGTYDGMHFGYLKLSAAF